MALITRISRLFTADLHAVIDRLEEPDVLLKQAVREMQDELVKCERRRQGLEREHERLGRQEAEIAAALADIDEQLDLCFASGEDALAKALIRRKLPQQALLKLVRSRRANAEVDIEAVRARQVEHRRRLESIRQKAELLAERSAPAPEESARGGDFAVTDEDIEVAFLKEKSSRRPS